MQETTEAGSVAAVFLNLLWIREKEEEGGRRGRGGFGAKQIHFHLLSLINPHLEGDSVVSEKGQGVSDYRSAFAFSLMRK